MSYHCKPVFKRRPKKFFGVQKQAIVVGATDERPVPVETASSKKLAISSSISGPSDQPSESCNYVSKLKGNRIVDCENVIQALGSIGLCNDCKSPLTLSEDLATRRGLVSKLAICCTNAKCNKEVLISDPYSKNSKSLNTRSVFGMREIGRGRNSLDTFCGLMDLLPPLVGSSYAVYNQSLAEASSKAGMESMLAACAYLHKLKGSEPTSVIDIAVTFDGTWSKRGFTATHGVVLVIAWETGQVLDFEILSKRCTACSKKKTKLGENFAAFEEWFKGHEPQCEMNHHGSSPAMECAGAVALWRRSEETRYVRYTEVISDGDSKTIEMLNTEQPYGDNVMITKHECVGHVQKRVGKHLRAMKKDINAFNRGHRQELKALKADLKKAKENLKGRRRTKRKGKLSAKEEAVVAIEEKIESVKSSLVTGVMNDATIDKLQRYYGNAIRANPNNLVGMTNACWAVFYHSMSTDSNPQHQYCLTGPESWCKYQRALALGEDVPAHHTTIPTDFVPFVKPIFSNLCKVELLQKCLLGATQNRNESFNALVWARAPKTEFCGAATVQIATNNAVIVFNNGSCALTGVMEKLRVQPGPLCISHLASRDARRIKKSQAKEETTAKRRRQTKRAADLLTEELRIEEEGITYESGGF